MGGNETVVISRKWHSPVITVTHDNNGISISLDREDFAKALALAVIQPPWYYRLFAKPAAYEAAAIVAFEAVVEEAKKATIHHPVPMPQ